MPFHSGCFCDVIFVFDVLPFYYITPKSRFICTVHLCSLGLSVVLPILKLSIIFFILPSLFFWNSC